ncbi:MAG: DNA recombination protein RmuC, partial [Proteobacteria bacterium]|nr:DNA recombination protein RmuC [Pseudomonadota bacterium]
REQAGLIQAEVATMLKDVARLDGRVGKLQSHFDQANEDLRQIRISTEKIAKRGTQIAEVEFEEIEAEAEAEAIGPQLKAVSDD